jgi:predicted PurR-regulated permease PerM
MRGTVQNVSFLLLVALTTLAFFGLIHDFLTPVFWAAVLATLFHPLHRRCVVALGGRRSPAALLTILAIMVLVVVPLFFIGLAMSREALALHERVRSGAVDLRAPLRFLEGIAPVVIRYLDRWGIDVDGIVRQISTAAVTVSQFLASRALEVGQNVLWFGALFFLMLYVLFFFLRDGDRIVEAVIRALPLGDLRERRLVAKFAEVSRATIKGTLIVGVVQGALGGLLFWILGIPAPVFWGAIMTVLSILPAVGAGLVWAPAAIILLARGEIVKGVVMLAAGILIIGLVDNVLRPVLVGRDTQMPDYLILLATLGGLGLFGISGFVIGPVIAAFFLVVWEMFAQEHAEGSVVGGGLAPRAEGIAVGGEPPPPATPEEQFDAAARPGAREHPGGSTGIG